jgi:hypothetical protein
MIPKKIDQKTASELKTILNKLNIQQQRVVIDLEKKVGEVEEEDYSTNDILEAAGVLTPERANEVREEVKRSREEWD